MASYILLGRALGTEQSSRKCAVERNQLTTLRVKSCALGSVLAHQFRDGVLLLPQPCSQALHSGLEENRFLRRSLCVSTARARTFCMMIE